jgi:hypothetical protein
MSFPLPFSFAFAMAGVAAVQIMAAFQCMELL